jgi:hypothetical protein
MIPEDQASAALSAGGKRASKVIAPTGDVRWIPEDSLPQARSAGGTVVHDDGSFQVTPMAGESFADTMKRAANAGKSVSPEVLRSQTIKGLKEAPAVLAAAPVAGFAGAGALTAVGAAGGMAPQALKASIEAVKAHPFASTAIALHFAREVGIPVPKSLDKLNKFLGGKP